MWKFDDYAKAIGLEQNGLVAPKSRIVEAVKDAKFTGSREDVEALYSYKIPEVSKDGACSRVEKLQPTPFNLAEHLQSMQDPLIQKPSAPPRSPLGKRKAPASADETKQDLFESLLDYPMTHRLHRLKLIMDALAKTTGVDWLGVYRLLARNTFESGKEEAHASSPVLVKEAYVGAPSRPDFPVSSAFAEKSNNAWVAVNKTSKLIQDTQSYEGAYYSCDHKVQSEFCLPLLRAPRTDSEDSSLAESAVPTLLGIIDAESWKVNYFNAEKLAEIVQICMDLSNDKELFP